MIFFSPITFSANAEPSKYPGKCSLKKSTISMVQGLAEDAGAGMCSYKGIRSDLSGGELEKCSQKCLGSLRIQLSQETFSFCNTKMLLKILRIPQSYPTVR